jgi:hypothetical protein
VDVSKLCSWIGFLNMGCSFILMNVVRRRLQGTGYKTGGFEGWRPAMNFSRPAGEYLYMLERYGWSALPARLVWIMIAAGIGFMIPGLQWNHGSVV